MSTVALQASTALEVLTPLFPHLFLPLASISNVGKNISWLAGSATKAQMHASLALKDNLGDVTAKVTAQSIAVCATSYAIVPLLCHVAILLPVQQHTPSCHCCATPPFCCLCNSIRHRAIVVPRRHFAACAT
jgi:hypothetical protein